MIYLAAAMLAAAVGWVIAGLVYECRHPQKLYHMRGIQRLLYPASRLLYRRVFRRRAQRRAEAYARLYPSEDPQILAEKSYLKNISCALAVFAACGALALIVSVCGTGKTLLTDGRYIERREQGGGSRTVELTARADGLKEKLTVTVGEKRLPPEQMETLKDGCRSYIMQQVLGANISLEHVTQDLNFFSEIPQYSVQVRWESGDYLIVGADGTVKNQDLEDGVPVRLTAVCTYFDTSWEHTLDIVVEPPERDGRSLFKASLEKALASREALTAGEDYMALPDSVDGRAVSWSEPKDFTPGVVLALGGAAILLIFAREGERSARALKNRSAQLSMDYPVFVHKVVLLLGTGMTSKAVWFRIISDYNKNLKEGGGRRFVYEEMIVAANEMKQGVTEAEAYDHFGRRCGTGPYLRFCSILIQTVRTGAAGMGRMLAEAGEEAVAARRENAKRVGEEAGTKLLFPMIALLGVVMCIVIVPAFMSMGF